MSLEFAGELKISLCENVLYATLEKRGFSEDFTLAQTRREKQADCQSATRPHPEPSQGLPPKPFAKGRLGEGRWPPEEGGGGVTCRAPGAHTPAGPLCVPSRSSLPSPALPRDSCQGLLLLPPARPPACPTAPTAWPGQQTLRTHLQPETSPVPARARCVFMEPSRHAFLEATLQQ